MSQTDNTISKNKDAAARAFSKPETLSHHICETPAVFLARALQNQDNHYILMHPADEKSHDEAERPLKLFDPGKQPHRKRIYALSDENGLVLAAASTYNALGPAATYPDAGNLYYLLDISVRLDRQNQGLMKVLLNDIMTDFEDKGLVLGGFFTKHPDSPKLANAYSKLHGQYPNLAIDYDGETRLGHESYSVSLKDNRAIVTPSAASTTPSHSIAPDA